MLYFDALAQTLHFGRAAKLAGVSQPALSSQIAEMEEGLKEQEGDALDRAIERLDHFKVIQQQIVSTAMH